MPSARELLEQADALMRRNRSRETISPAMGPRTMAPAIGAHPPAVAAGDFPVLTDALDGPSSARATPVGGATGVQSAAMQAPSTAPPAVERPVLQPQVMQSPVAQSPAAQSPTAQSPAMMPAAAASAPMASPEVSARQPSSMPLQQPASPAFEAARDLRDFAEPAMGAEPTPVPPANLDAPRPVAKAFTDVPVLTDAIEEIDAALLAAAGEGEPSIWNDEAMQGDDSVLGPAPKSIAVIPDARDIDESHRRNAEVAAAAAAESATASAVAASTAELIDEVRMQVLQRIDMFTDTGLREQLGERLKPIVDRASAELVTTINQHVGELLRTYVAEAIERELDRLRNELR